MRMRQKKMMIVMEIFLSVPLFEAVRKVDMSGGDGWR